MTKRPPRWKAWKPGSWPSWASPIHTRNKHGNLGHRRLRQRLRHGLGAGFAGIQDPGTGRNHARQRYRQHGDRTGSTIRRRSAGSAGSDRPPLGQAWSGRSGYGRSHAMGRTLQEKDHATAAGKSCAGFRTHHGGKLGTAPSVAGKRTFRRLAGRCERLAPARAGQNLKSGNKLLSRIKFTSKAGNFGKTPLLVYPISLYNNGSRLLCPSTLVASELTSSPTGHCLNA